MLATIQVSRWPDGSGQGTDNGALALRSALSMRSA